MTPSVSGEALSPAIPASPGEGAHMDGYSIGEKMELFNDKDSHRGPELKTPIHIASVNVDVTEDVPVEQPLSPELSAFIRDISSTWAQLVSFEESYDDSGGADVRSEAASDVTNSPGSTHKDARDKDRVSQLLGKSKGVLEGFMKKGKEYLKAAQVRSNETYMIIIKQSYVILKLREL